MKIFLYGRSNYTNNDRILQIFNKLSLFILSVLFSLNASANTPTEKTVTFNLKNVTLINVISQIEKQTNYLFVFDEQVVNINKLVTIIVKDSKVEDVLTKILDGSNVEFKIEGKNIILKKKSASSKIQGIPNIARISGMVLDEKREPIIGASIIIKGTTDGTISDVNGKFYLDAESDAKLKISYIGYQPIEVSVNNQRELKIFLIEDSKALEEIVVIGYGTQRRSLVTSAISKVKFDDSNLRNVASPSQLLEGRVAGVTVSTTSGNLGTGERMSIRGASSLSASNEPLYVVDGIPITNSDANIYNFGESMSSLATLNLTDIESIEVLKDAASAAIYGSRATNGVIVITTKSGKSGRSDVKLNVNTGFSNFANKNRVKLANSDLYLLQYNEGIDNYNTQYGYKVGDSGFKTHISNPFQGLPDSDWLSYITQTGSFVNADLSFSGGVNKTNYYIGGNIGSQEGIIKTNALQKVNLKAKISNEITPWLEVGANLSGNYVKNSQVPGANLGSTILARAIEQRPFDRPYKPNGNYYMGGTDELVFHNPIQILNEETSYFDNFRYLGSFYATLKFNNKFSLKNSINSDIGYTYDYTYYNENHPYGTGTGRIIEYNKFVNNILIENIANYNDKFGDLNLGLMLGHSLQKISSHTSMIDGRGFPSPSFDVLSVASDIYDASGSISEYAMESYFGRSTLSYLEKYILTLTMRTDGSSKFAPTTRWGWFPSVSLGWNISKEEFLKNSGMDMKFRVSYGKTGNQEGIGNYSYQSLMSGGQNYGLLSGIATTSFGNRNLTWETADQFDVGFDIEFLKGKINMIIDAYLKNTNNLLYSMPIHATTGVTSIMSNVGSMRNMGLEFTFNTQFKLGKVDWTSQFNISTNNNVITGLIGDDKPLSIGGNRALQVGKELGAFYLFKMEGIYQYDGEIPQEIYDLGVRAGDVKWYDADDNHIINDNDRQVMEAPTPDFFGGWNNSFKYKGFQLDAFLTYMYGNEVYNQRKATTLGVLGTRTAILESYVNNRWTGPGTTNVYPRSINSGTNNSKNSDRWLEDGSFIRLRTLTLGYNLPNKILKSLNLKGLRIFTQCDNLFLLTKYTGYDPEVSTELDPTLSSVDLLAVPQPRTISFGANFSF